MAQLFVELAIVLVVTFVISMLMNKLKQPLLVGYILTGVVAGPIFFNLLSDPTSYEVFAHIGVAFLLFIVGLQLNLKLVKEVGMISVITGIGQIVFTTLFGFLINLWLGFAWVPSLLIAVALTFSSTIIIVKLLSDMKGLEQLYGKISLGFLLVQDLVAVLILMIVGTFTTGATSFIAVAQIVLWGIAAVIAVFLIGKFVLPRLLKTVAHYKELLFLFIVAWCFGIAVGFQSIGFSLEIGALLAGVVLASTPYQQELEGRIKPLRDFFIILFFIFLGTQLIPLPEVALAAGEQWAYIAQTLGPTLPKAIILSLFVLLGNPAIVLALVTRFGYSARTGFLSGLTVSQISEFSLIMALLAQQAGFLTRAHISLITLVAVITITSSTYLVTYGESLYERLHPFFKGLEKKKLKDTFQGVQGKKHDIGVFGFHRIGFHVLRAIQKTGHSYLVVDHNPETVSDLQKREVPALFGDVSSVEFLSEFDFKDMTLLISTIPTYGVSKKLLQNYRAQNKEGVCVLTAEHHHEAMQLYEQGADYVIVPQHLGGNHIEALIHDYNKDEHRFLIERIRHLEELRHKPF